MRAVRTRGARAGGREIVLVSLAGLAAFLFLNHENLYLTGPFTLRDVRVESYVLATIVIYLFLRLVILAAEMRPARAPSELVRCPECGQWTDDPLGAVRGDHHVAGAAARKPPSDAPAAVALRKAVESARIAPISSRPDEEGVVAPVPALHAPTSHDLIAALTDPDLLERLRHSPRAPEDPRLRR